MSARRGTSILPRPEAIPRENLRGAQTGVLPAALHEPVEDPLCEPAPQVAAPIAHNPIHRPAQRRSAVGDQRGPWRLRGGARPDPGRSVSPPTGRENACCAPCRRVRSAVDSKTQVADERLARHGRVDEESCRRLGGRTGGSLRYQRKSNDSRGFRLARRCASQLATQPPLGARIFGHPYEVRSSEVNRAVVSCPRMGRV